MQWRGCNGKAISAPVHAARLAPRAAQDLRGALAAEPPLEVQPQLPLCEREPRHAVPLAALLAWHEAARRRIAGVGDSWAALDEGPSSEDLDTELGWLVDDSLAAWAPLGGEWRPVSWRQLERDLRQLEELRDSVCQYRVQLREPLEGLGGCAGPQVGKVRLASGPRACHALRNMQRLMLALGVLDLRIPFHPRVSKD